MADGFYRALCRVLIGHGCRFIRSGKGDHEIWFSPITQINVTVDRGTKSRHTANAVLKQAGIDERL